MVIIGNMLFNINAVFAYNNEMLYLCINKNK